MKGVIYVTRIKECDRSKKLEHMIGEKLLETALKQEYGLSLSFEPRAAGEHGKPFFTLQPGIHYNISHSGDYVVCILAGQEVGIDIQIHRPVRYESMLRRMVPEELAQEILGSENREEEFFAQWVLRETYIKWTGEGLSRDLRTIPMEEGWHKSLFFAEGYSSAVWAQEEMELCIKEAEITLDE